MSSVHQLAIDIDRYDRAWDRVREFLPHPKAGHQSRLYRRMLRLYRRTEDRHDLVTGEDWALARQFVTAYKEGWR